MSKYFTLILSLANNFQKPLCVCFFLKQIKKNKGGTLPFDLLLLFLLLYRACERDKTKNNGLFVFLGAQFGTVISMPLSGLLSVSSGGWPSIFYVFGAVGTIWSLAFVFWVYEDPEVHPRINPDERKYILNALWGAAGVTVSLN